MLYKVKSGYLKLSQVMSGLDRLGQVRSHYVWLFQVSSI